MNARPIFADVSQTLWSAAWTERLGWTLLHSVWQIAAVAAVAGGALVALRRSSPHARYLAGCGALAAMLAAPVCTFLWILSPKGGAETVTLRTARQDAPVVVADEGRVVVADVDGPPPTPQSATTQVRPISGSSETRTAAARQASHVTGSWSERIKVALPWLSWAWLAGVLVASTRPLAGWITVRRLRKRGNSGPSAELEVIGKRLAAQLAIGRDVVFAESTLVDVPSVVGYLRPLVLVPASIVSSLSPMQLQSILVHELAHIRRHDYLVNLFQTFVEGLLFYHPGVWWISARLRQERENCCDDLAVQFAASRADYVRALAILEEQRLAGVPFVLAASGGSLLVRARRLLGGTPEPPRRFRQYTSAACVAGLLAIAVAGSLVVAGQLSAAQQGGGQPGDGQRPARATRVILSHVDGTAEGMRSIAASGHAVRFNRDERATFVEAIEIFASRYGTPQPPPDDFEVYLLNDEFQVLRKLDFGYRLIPRGDLKWHVLRMPATEVPEKFYVALAFNPHQTKGIYLGLDESVSETHSLTGLAADGFEEWNAQSDWMVRVRLTNRPTGRSVQRLSDWKPPAAAADPFEGAIEVRFDDGKSAGQQSYGGAGPVLTIPVKDIVPDGADVANLQLAGLRIYASRYGSGYDPDETIFYASVLDADAEAAVRQEVPYAKLGYEERWVDVVFDKPIPVSRHLSEDGVLTLGIDPEAHQRKGIYFHYSQGDGEGRSRGYVPGERFFDVEDRRWMIRAYLTVEAQ